MDEVFPEPPDDAPFWRRLKWHMQRGTRPPGENSHRGRWTNTELGGAVRLSGQAVGRWITEQDHLRTLPTEPNILENKLFSAKPDQDDAWYATQRRKFRSALARAQAEADRRKITKSQATRNEREPVGAPLAPSSERLRLIAKIPIRPPLHFLGRKRDLLRMWDKLEGEIRSGFAPPTIALHGIRGVGKTSLAVTYANAHLDHYRVRWWLNAGSTDLLCDGLRSLGLALGWITDGGAKEEEDGRAAARSVLSHLNVQGDGILLIYDNAPDANIVRPFLPTSGGARSIITSNAHVWGSLAAPIEVAVWPKEVGADYILRRTARPAGERTEGEKLSQALEGLPLALEQAAAYCETLNVSFSEYLRRFEASPLNLLDSKKYAPPDYHDRRTVAKSFKLAMDAIQDQDTAFYHPAAEMLLLHIALLGPFHIPISLLYRGIPKLRELMPDLVGNEDIDQAAGALMALGLVKREPVPDDINPQYAMDCIRLHRLVRLIVMEGFPRGLRVEAERFQLTKVLPIAYPDVEMLRDPSTEQFARSLDAILRHLLGADVIYGDDWDPFVEGMLTRAAYHSLRSSASDETYRRLMAPVDWHTEEAFFASQGVASDDVEFRRDIDPQGPDKNPVGFGRDDEIRHRVLTELRRSFRTHGALPSDEMIFRTATVLIEMGEHGEACITLQALLHSWRYRIRSGEFNADAASGEEGSEETDARSNPPPTRDRLTTIHGMLVGSCRHLTASIIHDLALAFDSIAQPGAAQPLYEQALAMREATQECGHPDIAVTLADFGIFLWRYNLPGARDALERADSLFRLRPDREPERFASCREHLARLASEQPDTSTG